MSFQRILYAIAVALLLAGCAATPESKTLAGKPDVTPEGVAANIGEYRARVVEWGCVILGATNLRERTELKVLAYPLDRDGRPETDRSALGRFIAVNKGYLETADYAAGRRVTLSGRVMDVREGRVGEADYRFPVVSVDDLRLWPKKEAGGAVRPRIHFGIGVGSGGRPGVGIGVGF